MTKKSGDCTGKAPGGLGGSGARASATGTSVVRPVSDLRCITDEVECGAASCPGEHNCMTGLGSNSKRFGLTE